MANSTNSHEQPADPLNEAGVPAPESLSIETSTSRGTLRKPQIDGSTSIENPQIPTAWLTHPIFLVPTTARTMNPISILVDNQRWTFGAPNPFTLEPSRRLTVEHAGCLFTILGMFADNEALERAANNEPVSMDISFTDLALRLSYSRDGGEKKRDSKNGRMISDLRRIVDDLRNTYFCFSTDEGTGKERRRVETTFSLLHGVALKRIHRLGDSSHEDETAYDTRHADWLDKVVIHPIMARFALGMVRLVTFRVGVFRNFRSEIARAIYLYIPSRSIMRTADNPWRISLTKLLYQIGHPQISYDPKQDTYLPLGDFRYISRRHRYFTQNGSPTEDTAIDGRLSNSILAQLDGASISGGRFRCRVELNADESDYLFVCWRETAGPGSQRSHKPTATEEPGKLKQAWLTSGRSVREFDRLIAELPNFTHYESECFESASIDLRSTTLFFRQAKALLGETHFDSLLREAVQEQQGLGETPRNPTGLLISRIITAFVPAKMSAKEASLLELPSSIQATPPVQSPSTSQFKLLADVDLPIQPQDDFFALWDTLPTTDQQKLITLAKAGPLSASLRGYSEEEMLSSPLFETFIRRHLSNQP